MDYSLTYFAKSPFTITADDGDASSCAGIQLPDPDAALGVVLSGEYTPVAVIDYAPETNYGATDVLAQSIDVTFDSSLGASSLWYSTNCDNPTLTQLIADGATNSPDDSTKSVLSSVLSGGTLPAGQLLLIDSPLQAKDPPSASIGSFNAAAGGGGDIVLNWGLSGTPLAGDKVSVSITDEAGDVFSVDLDRTVVTYTYSGSSTTHGESYDVEVAVCNNDGLCSTPIGSGTVVADKQVDGADATGVSVVEAGDKWTLTWSSTGTSDDVASWSVCYQSREAFDEVNMPTTCVDTATAATMTADVMMPTTGQGTVYFAVVPVDALGNKGTASSSGDAGADASYVNEIDNGGITNNTDSDDTSSGELPGWTWGAIGGVVVVAFIAGAFILSRGGSEGEDKDWDY